MATDRTLHPRDIQWYGWRPQLPDLRDRVLAMPAMTVPETLPRQTNNYAWAEALGVYDQGALGSCTANGTLWTWRAALLREGQPDVDGARLAHYYWTRVIERSTKYDSGATIRDAVKVLTKKGVAPEAKWPYNVARFAVAPTAAVSRAATPHRACEYLAVPQTRTAIEAAVAHRMPVVFGYTVYESTERALDTDGLVPMPTAGESVAGGHCQVIADYDAGYCYGPNSWGTDVGLADKPGWTRWPWAMLLDPNIAGDFWVVQQAV